MDIFEYFEKQKLNYKKDMELNDCVIHSIGDYNLISEIINPDNSYYILLWVDADCDGQSAGIILSEILDQFCIPYYLHISKREDGYGINNERLDSLKLSIKKTWGLDGNNYENSHKLLLLTADLGITNKAECEYAYSIGFDKIIITDHHTVDYNNLPKVDLIVNNKLGTDNDILLCGAGLVYMIFKEYANQKTKIIAGIATIGDMVPLHYGSINRTIVKESLDIINNEYIQDDKLRYLLSNLIYNYGRKKVTEMDYAFSICPTFNSLSRLLKEDLLKEYFSIDCRKEKTLVEEIKSINTDRKNIQSKHERIVDNIISNTILSKDTVNIIYIEEIQSSMIGLISSYILNKYGYDNICITKSSYGYKGSGRSENYDIYNYVKQLCNIDKDISGNGHLNAVGLKTSNYNNVINASKSVIPKKIESTEDKNIYDLSHKDINNESLWLLYNYFAPYGNNNKSPKVKIDNLKVITKKKVKNHIFVLCELLDVESDWDTNNTIEVVFFKYTEDECFFKKNNIISVVCEMSEGNFIAEEVSNVK